MPIIKNNFFILSGFDLERVSAALGIFAPHTTSGMRTIRASNCSCSLQFSQCYKMPMHTFNYELHVLGIFGHAYILIYLCAFDFAKISTLDY